MATFLEGITISGLPGSFFEYNRKRKPLFQSSFRIRISGVVSKERTLRIFSELFVILKIIAVKNVYMAICQRDSIGCQPKGQMKKAGHSPGFVLSSLKAGQKCPDARQPTSRGARPLANP
jgi:hypothetical protein